MLLSKLFILDQVDSTNNYIAKLAKRGIIPHGTVVLSYNQTEGKGQRGSEWISEPGRNLAFSLFLEHHNTDLKRQNYLSYAIALGVVDLMKDRQIEAKIKWPNDILVNNKKLGGILIENQIANNALKSSVVGIGINVNQRFDEVTQLSATSMTKLQGEEINLESLWFDLVDKLDYRYNQYESGDYDLLEKDFKEKLWMIGQEVDVEIQQTKQKAIILGVNENGLLELQVDGKVLDFDLKEVKFFY